MSALAVCTGLVLLLTADASSLTGEPHRNRVFMATVCVVSLVLILRQLSRRAFPSLLVGVAAGLCHSLNAVYLKLTVEDLFKPSITTVVQPAYDIGYHAAQILLNRIEQATTGDEPATVRLPATLKICDSSRLPSKRNSRRLRATN